MGSRNRDGGTIVGWGMTTRRQVTAAVIVVLGLLAAGCGDDEPGAASTSTTVAAATADGGWIGGEPDWSGGGAEALATMPGVSGDVTVDESGPHVAPSDEPLRAGSIDDNADLDGFLAYLDRLDELGIALRPYDPTGRVVVAVNGTSGRPVAGADVTVSVEGAEVARLRTTADGTVRFHPALHGAAGSTSFEVASGGATATVEPGGHVTLESDAPGGAEGSVAVDVLFLLDATGSMGDEIDQLKVSIDQIAARIAALESAPDIRLAMTLYRDEGDAFVTSTYDFTGDVAAFRSALADVQAAGGGDYAEALDEGLAEALAAPSWRDASETVQLVFLVADAPPQVGRDVPVPYTDSIREAVGRGVKIFPVASSESDDQAEGVFRQLAQATGSRFVFLSYGAGGAATGSSTDIATTDYEELALDDLVVRLVAEELDALTGGSTVVPTTTTSSTVPQGQ